MVNDPAFWPILVLAVLIVMGGASLWGVAIMIVDVWRSRNEGNRDQCNTSRAHDEQRRRAHHDAA